MGAVEQKTDKRLSKPDIKVRLQLSINGRIFVKHQFKKMKYRFPERLFPGGNTYPLTERGIHVV
jgi:hypothetical protein